MLDIPMANERSNISIKMDLRAQEPVRNKAINRSLSILKRWVFMWYVIYIVYRIYDMSNVYDFNYW